jgi:hypothetical protein
MYRKAIYSLNIQPIKVISFFIDIKFIKSAFDKNLEILKKEGILESEDTKGGIWILHHILQHYRSKKKTSKKSGFYLPKSS